MPRLARSLALLGVLALAGCPSGPTPRADDPNTHRVALVTSPGCCQARRLVGELQRALARRGPVWRLQGAPPAAPPDPSSAAAVRTALRQAHTHYVSLRLDRARRELQSAVALVEQTAALGVSPDELGRIHLYLGALAHAERRSAEVVRRAEAAVRYAPELRPDPDVFSPPIREAVEAARRARQPVELTITSEPPGADLTWDGAGRGQTPLELSHESRGEHFLRLDHALCEPWHEVIRLSTGAALRVKLRPAPPSQIAALLRTRPELFEQGVALLGVEAVLWLSEDRGALRLEARARGGQLRSAQLPAEASGPALERALAEVLPPATTH